MKTSNQLVGTLCPSDNHVVDWQIVRAADAATDQTRDCKDREMRGRLNALEARALKLSRAVVRDPAAVVARRSLVALDTEIATLRAQLAWHRAEARERQPRSLSA